MEIKRYEEDSSRLGRELAEKDGRLRSVEAQLEESRNKIGVIRERDREEDRRQHDVALQTEMAKRQQAESTLQAIRSDL